MEATALDLESRYTVDGYGGVAWVLLGHVMVRDEDYEWSGIEYPAIGRVRMVMVGDDSVFEFGTDEITPLKDEDYCHECGQVGCKADGRSE